MRGSEEAVAYFPPLTVLVLLSLAPLISLGGCSDKPPDDAVYTRVAVFVDLTEIEERGGSTRLEDPGVLETLPDVVLGTSEEDSFDGGSISFYRLSDESLLRLSFSENIDLGTANQNPVIRSEARRTFRDSTLAVRFAAPPLLGNLFRKSLRMRRRPNPTPLSMTTSSPTL